MPKKPRYAKAPDRYIPADPRAALTQLSERLLRLRFPTSPLPVKDAHWLGHAISRYLAKTNPRPSLDRELDLVGLRGEGRKKASPEDLDWGALVVDLRVVDRLTWDSVCDELEKRGHPERDESTVRQRYQRILPDVIDHLADRVARALAEDPP